MTDLFFTLGAILLIGVAAQIVVRLLFGWETEPRGWKTGGTSSHHLRKAPGTTLVVEVLRLLAQTIGLRLPVEQLRVDAIPFNQPVRPLAPPATALVALDVEHLGGLPTRSRKMMAPSRRTALLAELFELLDQGHAHR